MTQQEVEEILHDLVREGYRTRCLLDALIEHLIDQGVLGGDEESIKQDLEVRAKLLEEEGLLKHRAEARAALLLKAVKEGPCN